MEDPFMLNRLLSQQILTSLADTPVVFLQGPRQAGKTTLVNGLPELGWDAEYRTLDEAASLLAAKSDPDGFVAGLSERAIIDEVQRAPELFRAIKLSVDRKRQPGRFLLTGSANALVLPQVADSLAGRMEILTLLPLSQAEIEGRVPTFLEAIFEDVLPSRRLEAEGWPAVARRITAGGFPEARSRKDPQRRAAWFASYITTILERDIRDLANIQSVAELARLLRLIAIRAGGILNLSDLARDAAIPQTTLQRYWALLEAIFFVRSVPAWSGNLGLRVIKAPKTMLYDSGLLCHLLGVDYERLKNDDLWSGVLLENFAALEILKQTHSYPHRFQLFHYRTHKKQEVDLLLEDAQGRVVAIEVKKTASPTASDLQGLRQLRDSIGERFHRGILLYLGTDWVSLDPSLHALPISALWQV